MPVIVPAPGDSITVAIVDLNLSAQAFNDLEGCEEENKLLQQYAANCDAQQAVSDSLKVVNEQQIKAAAKALELQKEITNLKDMDIAAIRKQAKRQRIRGAFIGLGSALVAGAVGVVVGLVVR